MRHLHVHQDQGVGVLFGQFERLLAILGQINEG
jgi:hypothetical protein